MNNENVINVKYGANLILNKKGNRNENSISYKIKNTPTSINFISIDKSISSKLENPHS